MFHILISMLLSGCAVSTAQSLYTEGVCQAQPPCQNGGQLACTYSCHEQGIQADLKCFCECSDYYYGALCELLKPCYDPPTTATTELPTTTPEILPGLMIGAQKDIVLVDFDAGTNETILADFNYYILSLAVDWAKQLVFFSSQNVADQVVIFQLSISSGVITQVTVAPNQFNFIMPIAVDPVNDYIFYSHFTNNFVINYVDYGGSNTVTVESGMVDIATGITLDYMSKVMYWVNRNIYVQKCNYTGSCEDLTTVNVYRPTGLTLDLNEQVLFWTGADNSAFGSNYLYSYNIHTGVNQLLATINGGSQFLVGPVVIRGLDLYLMHSSWYKGCSNGQFSLFRVPVTGGDNNVTTFGSTFDGGCYNFATLD